MDASHPEPDPRLRQGQEYVVSLWSTVISLSTNVRVHTIVVFGVPLAQLLEREKRTTNIPLILEKSITQLRSIDPTFTTEGLFRVTGDISVINHLKDLLDACTFAHEAHLSLFLF